MRNNPLINLYNWVEDRRNNETLDFTSPKTLERGLKILDRNIKKLLLKQNKAQIAKVRKKMTDSYYRYIKKDFEKRNIGLKGWRIEELKKPLREELQERIGYSISLIKTQNENNLGKLKSRFINWVNMRTMEGVNDETSLKQALQLEKEVGKSNKHIRFILKDQTMKMLGDFDYVVAKHYGAICFIWKNRKDKRVVGNPSGKYKDQEINPKIHGNHWIREGKYYFYKDSWAFKQGLIDRRKVSYMEDLEDGMPGKPIGCRCYAVNIYNIEDVPKEFRKKIN